MRLIIFFDLPVKTKQELKRYREFVKYLKNEGCLRVQYSVYAKLCINNDAAITATKRLKTNTPAEGDVRYMVVTERQYQNIISVNNKYNLQEEITTTDRTLMIGGMNNESSGK